MIDQITTYIVSILPSLTAILAMVVMVVKVLKSFKTLRDEVVNSNRMKKIEEQIQIVVQENYELKRQIKLMVQKLDKVKIKDNKDNKDNKEVK